MDAVTIIVIALMAAACAIGYAIGYATGHIRGFDDASRIAVAIAGARELPGGWRMPSGYFSPTPPPDRDPDHRSPITDHPAKQ